MNNETNKKKLIIVMRHGEREDDQSIKKENEKVTKFNEYDPALTNNGVNQAKSIGNQLREFFQSELFSNQDVSKLKIKIYSSPFLRTLMTASSVIDGIMNGDHDKYQEVDSNIYNGLYEYLNDRHFKNHPHDFLEINGKNENIHISSLKEKFTWKTDSDNLPNFPETLDESITRYNRAIEKLKNEFEKDYNHDIMIIVTHGYGVQVMASFLYIPDEFFIVDYCSTFIFELDQKSKESKYLTTINPQ
jgi:broad specificity phosphatase PhoE